MSNIVNPIYVKSAARDFANLVNSGAKTRDEMKREIWSFEDFIFEVTQSAVLVSCFLRTYSEALTV